MAEHPNVARVRAGYAAFATGDFAVLTDLFAEDLVWHVGGRSQIAGEYRGRDAVFALLGKIEQRSAAPLIARACESGTRSGRTGSRLWRPD